MSKNTHCQALLQRNKHNEQQSHPCNTQKFRQPAKENPNVGKPKEREILLASGKYISNKVTFSSQENHLQTQFVLQTCCLETMSNLYNCKTLLKSTP
jgi:hypothetical protein